ncbi:hypothetical protein ACJ7V3_06840 [Halomonas elongata]|uniref:hypothetical protein n=1 Tax=Halomonas elongata TaxID=2746 RepID=UPI0038D3D8FC
MATKECPYCREEINKKAKKCKYCQQHLNFLKYINPSHTTLALIVAAITVAGTLIDNVNSLLSHSNSEISLSPAKLSDDTISFAVINAGNRPGWISNASIQLVVDMKGYGEIKSIYLLNSSKTNFPPNSSSNEVKLTAMATKLPIVPRHKDATSKSTNKTSQNKKETPRSTELEKFTKNFLATAIIEPLRIKSCRLNVGVRNFDGTEETITQDILGDKKSMLSEYRTRIKSNYHNTVLESSLCQQFIASTTIEAKPNISNVLREKAQDFKHRLKRHTEEQGGICHESLTGISCYENE